MNLITRQSLANQMAKKWEEHTNDKAHVIYKKLKALGDNPNPDTVDEIIGNTSWTAVGACHECGKTSEKLVELGEEPDYESNTARICLECLQKAMILMV